MIVSATTFDENPQRPLDKKRLFKELVRLFLWILLCRILLKSTMWKIICGILDWLLTFSWCYCTKILKFSASINLTFYFFRSSKFQFSNMSNLTYATNMFQNYIMCFKFYYNMYKIPIHWTAKYKLTTKKHDYYCQNTTKFQWLEVTL